MSKNTDLANYDTSLPVANVITTSANLVLKTANTTTGGTLTLPTSGGLIVTSNSSVNAFTISSGGIPNFPYIPAFYTVGSGSTQSMSGAYSQTKLLANSTQYIAAPRSNGWSAASNRFTAPVAGTYRFQIKFACIAASSTGPVVFIFKNGTQLNETAINYVNISYVTCMGDVIIDLAASDYVEAYLGNYNSTSISLDTGRCSFGGHLIG